jgi:hypothetical protein
MIAVTIGITIKMDGTIALIAMSIATDRIRKDLASAAVRVDDVRAVVMDIGVADEGTVGRPTTV